jgi:hypothetical protein
MKKMTTEKYETTLNELENLIESFGKTYETLTVVDTALAKVLNRINIYEEECKLLGNDSGELNSGELNKLNEDK